MAHHKLTGIQLLRAVAACLVVFAHFGFSVESYHAGYSYFARVGFERLGGIGVDIFFVISGFIMVSSLEGRQDGPSAALQFLKRRALRIYPLYWIWTTVLLALWISGLALKNHTDSTTYLVASYFLWPIQNTDGIVHPFLDQGWSLIFEMFFYISLSICIAFKTGKTAIPVVAIAFIVAGYIADRFEINPSCQYLLNSPLLFEFLLGMVAGTVFIRLHAATTLVIPTKLVKCMLLASIAGLIGSFFLRWNAPSVVTYGIPASFMILSCALLKISEQNASIRVFTYLGNASYSIYLTHGFFTLAAGTLMKHGLGRQLNPDLIVVAGTVITIFVSAKTYTYVEVPLTRFFERRLLNARKALNQSVKSPAP